MHTYICVYVYIYIYREREREKERERERGRFINGARGKNHDGRIRGARGREQTAYLRIDTRPSADARTTRTHTYTHEYACACKHAHNITTSPNVCVYIYICYIYSTEIGRTRSPSDRLSRGQYYTILHYTMPYYAIL